jgi:hypothetical protein
VIGYSATEASLLKRRDHPNNPTRRPVVQRAGLIWLQAL